MSSFRDSLLLLVCLHRGVVTQAIRLTDPTKAFFFLWVTILIRRGPTQVASSGGTLGRYEAGGCQEGSEDGSSWVIKFEAGAVLVSKAGKGYF